MFAALFTLLAAVSLFVGTPVVLYFRNRGEALRRWRPRPVGMVALGDGGYRGAEVARLSAEGPPAHVHVTAVMCWVLGTAFVPGLVMGLYGLLALGLGLVSIPGLILAARLFRLGGPLLRGEAEAAPKARAAAGFARALNYVVLGLLGLASLAIVPRVLVSSHLERNLPTLAFIAFIGLYATVSLLHARLLDRAAEAIEAEQRAREAEGTQVRIDASEPAGSYESLAAQYDRSDAEPGSAARRAQAGPRG